VSGYRDPHTYGPDIRADDEAVVPPLPGAKPRGAVERFRRYRLSEQDTHDVTDVIAEALTKEFGVRVNVEVHFPVVGGPGIVVARDGHGHEITVDPDKIAAITQQDRDRPPPGRTLDDPSPGPSQRALAEFDAARTDREKLAIVLGYLETRSGS
jgi:hypothetical protein